MHLRDCFICKSPSPEVSRLRVSRACFTSRNLAQEGNILYKCLMFFFRFEVARNDHVELQASIFTFLSHSPRPWRAHGGVWSQMLTGWAASGCKEDCRTRMLRVFGNWWPILVLPHRRVPRKRSAWRCYCSCLTVLLLCLAVCGVYPCFCVFLFSLCVLKDSCVSALFDKAFPSAARFRAKGMCISGVGFGLFSLSKTASARCVLNVPLLPQDFL